MRSHKHRKPAGFSALLSIHDVMPETRHKVEPILQRLAAVPPDAIALLIVPGRAWTPDDLNWLHRLSAKGYTMVGHGWQHECDQPRALAHRLHSKMISNRAAEHLSLTESGITRLMCDCHTWLTDLGLGPVEVYIPPAWALGPIRHESLKFTPFRYIETLRGVYDTRTGRWRTLPVAGFEVDRASRAIIMRLVNRVNIWLAICSQRPLRIAIHPHDWQYPLAEQLDALLDEVSHYQSYRHVSAGSLSEFG